MDKGSHFSDDGKYRYQLWRIWEGNRKVAMCIGLNPSTAGSKKQDGTEKDDATITRLISSLKGLGYGGFYMVNLYAYITPHPEKLFSVPNALGDNDIWIANTSLITQEQIFCWGAFKSIEYRAKRMMQLFPDAMCFGKNADGSPWHPRALMYKGYKGDEASLTRFTLNDILR